MSKYFTPAEMNCRCGKCDVSKMDAAFMALLDELRERIGPLRVASGFRCPQHNLDVGGVPNSQHLFGRAVDLVCGDPERRAIILGNAWELGFRGFGIGKTFIHLDTRPGNKSVWSY